MKKILLLLKKAIFIALCKGIIMNIDQKEDLFQYLGDHFEKFTKTEKRFVHLILSKRYEISFLTAYEIANRIKANPSSLVRFAKKLGFKGYPELKKELAKLLVKEINYLGDFEKAKRLKKLKENNIIKKSLKKSYSNILDLLKDFDEQKLKLFSEKICASRKKIIIANRSSYSAGHFLYFILKKIIPQVHFLSDYDHGYYDILEDLNKRDVIIAISVYRYNKLTIDFAQYAVQRNLKLISITDSRISPLFLISSVCLRQLKVPLFITLMLRLWL